VKEKEGRENNNNNEKKRNRTGNKSIERNRKKEKYWKENQTSETANHQQHSWNRPLSLYYHG